MLKYNIIMSNAQIKSKVQANIIINKYSSRANARIAPLVQ